MYKRKDLNGDDKAGGSFVEEKEEKLLAETILAKDDKSLVMEKVLKGNGPKPTEKAEVLANFAKEDGANSLSAKMLSFTLPNAWYSLTQTRCKVWDDRELDIFEGVKAIGYILGQLTITSQFVMNVQLVNPWEMMNLMSVIACSGAICMETFTCFSGFFMAYKLFQIHDAKGGLSLKDIGLFYLNKYLRLAPFFYFIFFVSWALFPYLGGGPMWYTAHNMFDGCKDYWWAQVLFVSNLIPYFQAPNYGCFFWSWPVVTDMQLTLLTPIFVIIYKRCGSTAGHFFVLVCII